MTGPDPGQDGWPLTRAELARRYGVSPSTVTRALEQARARHRDDPSRPAPPEPVNPGQPLLRYLPADFDAWWPTRPGAGRPPAASPAAPADRTPRPVPARGTKTQDGA